MTMATSSAIADTVTETWFLRARPIEASARSTPSGPKKNAAMSAPSARESNGSETGG